MIGRQVALIQKSFEKLAAHGEEAGDIFYDELFAIDPSLRALFKGDMEQQKKNLLAALAILLHSLHIPEKILKPAQTLAVDHLDYGVRPEHYTYFGNALLRTLRKVLGADYTPEVRDAWVEAFRILAGIMKDAAYGGVKGAA